MTLYYKCLLLVGTTAQSYIIGSVLAMVYTFGLSEKEDERIYQTVSNYLSVILTLKNSHWILPLINSLT